MSFLKNLFKSSATKSGIVFIVEDNPVYAKILAESLKANFPQIKEVKKFPVGETCLEELHKNPDLIIIDHFLDSQYFDAETGLKIVGQIRKEKEKMNIIFLSSQQDVDIVKAAINKYHCSYVQKDHDSLL